MFTNTVTIKNKIESNTSSRSFRDPSRIDNRYTHSKIRDVSAVMQRTR
jgi:hypothetical protein